MVERGLELSARARRQVEIQKGLEEAKKSRFVDKSLSLADFPRESLIEFLTKQSGGIRPPTRRSLADFPSEPPPQFVSSPTRTDIETTQLQTERQILTESARQDFNVFKDIFSPTEAPSFIDIGQETTRGLFSKRPFASGVPSSIITKRRGIQPATSAERFQEFAGTSFKTATDPFGQFKKRKFINVKPFELASKLQKQDPVELAALGAGLAFLPAQLFVKIPAPVSKAAVKLGTGISRAIGISKPTVSPILEAGTLKIVSQPLDDIFGVGVAGSKSILRTPADEQLLQRSVTQFTTERGATGTELRLLSDIRLGKERFIVPTIAKVEPSGKVDVSQLVSGIFKVEGKKGFKLEKAIGGKAATTELTDAFLGVTSKGSLVQELSKDIIKIKSPFGKGRGTITESLFAKASEETKPILFFKKVKPKQVPLGGTKPFGQPAQKLITKTKTDDVVSSLVKTQLEEVTKLAKPSTKVSAKPIQSVVPVSPFLDTASSQIFDSDVIQTSDVSFRKPFATFKEQEAEQKRLLKTLDVFGVPKDVSESSKLGTSLSTVLGVSQIVGVSQAQKQAQDTAAVQELQTLTQPRPVGRVRGRGRGSRGLFGFPFFLDAKPGATTPASVRGKQGYDTFIKEQGRIKKLNDKARTKKGALAFGANFVDTTPAASFTIKKSKNKAEVNGGELWNILKPKFRQRKTKNALQLVEKEQFRIDSFGELRGITQKGIDVRRAI